ncbi:MAG: DEAD/DEAH box helicase [Chloroflexota bacterium]
MRTVDRFASKTLVSRATVLFTAAATSTGAGSEMRRPVKDRKPRNLPAADVYVFRYSNIGAWSVMADTLGCKTVIFDEVQELRHGRGTDKGRGARAFSEAAENVMGLTATPIYNYGGEMWNVVDLIAPGALGTWDEFLMSWCKGEYGEKPVVADPPALGAYLVQEGLALRRTAADAEVALSLPPLTKNVFEVEWNEGDAEADYDLRRSLAIRVLNGGFTERGQAARELDLLLRQETGIAKARSVAAYVRLLAEAGEPVVLTGWHREVYRIWNEQLADLAPVMFTGSESQAQKRKARNAFVLGETNVLIMSLRSGAGLDGLQERAAHVVFGELDWSPQVHVQVAGRLHRRGQTRPVTAHYLHVEGGSDPVIMQTLGLKASQSHGILNPFENFATATPVDTSRMRALAKAVLDQTAEAAE